MKLKDTFKAGVLASQLKATWLNAVAWCINTLHGGTHINVEIPAKAGEGTGIKVGIDMDGLCADLRNRGFYAKTTTEDESEGEGEGEGGDEPVGTAGNLASFDADGNLEDSGQAKPAEGCAFVQGKIDSFPTGNLVKAGTGDMIEDTGVKADDVIGVTEPEETEVIESGAYNIPSRLPLIDAPGKIFGQIGDSGAIVYLACRSAYDGADGSIYFRPFMISGDGRIYSIGPESDKFISLVGAE